MSPRREAPVAGDPYQVKSIFYYYIPPGMRPTFIVDVRAYIDDWMLALQAHKTQFFNPEKPKSKSQMWSVVDLIRAESQVKGFQMGALHAQSFLSVSPLRISDPMELCRGYETRP